MFIVGSPRSGTSLLRDLLRSHPRLTFPPESRVIPGLYRAFGDPNDAREARDAATALLRAAPLMAWGLDLDPGELEHERSFAGLASAVYGEWARLEGKPRWGDKTAAYALEIATLLELFPQAKVIHIYRDGRDCALSVSRQRWGQPNVFSAARRWRQLVTSAQAAGRTLSPETYREVSYEALITSPEAVLRELCVFIGERFDPAVLVPDRLPVNDPARPASFERRIEPSNVEKWRTLMPPADQMVFESVAGDVLEALGYPTLGLARSLKRSKRLAWRVEHGARFVRFRLHRRRGPDFVLTGARTIRARTRRRMASLRRQIAGPRRGAASR